MTISQLSVSLEDAQRVIAAGQAKADEIGSPSNVAVVDAGGNLVAHIRMDHAWVGSVDISINKAFTARAFDIATNPTNSTNTSHPPSLVTCLYTDLLATNTFISYLIDYPIILNTTETSQAPSDAHCLTRPNTLTQVALVTHNNRSFARLPRPPRPLL